MTRKVARREWARLTSIWKQGWGIHQKPGSPQLSESGQRSRERLSDLPPPPHHHKPKGSRLFDRGPWRGMRWVMWRGEHFSGPWFPPLKYGLVFWIPKVSPVLPQGGWRAEGACGLVAQVQSHLISSSSDEQRSTALRSRGNDLIVILLADVFLLHRGDHISGL